MRKVWTDPLSNAEPVVYLNMRRKQYKWREMITVSLFLYRGFSVRIFEEAFGQRFCWQKHCRFSLSASSFYFSRMSFRESGGFAWDEFDAEFSAPRVMNFLRFVPAPT